MAPRKYNIPSVMASSLALLVACFPPSATTRFVMKTPTSGVVALERADSPRVRATADRMMREHCRGAYEVVEEGEAVVGSTEQGSGWGQGSAIGGRPYGSPAGGSYQTHSSGSYHSEARDVTEWRLRFQCRGSGTADATQAAVRPATAASVP